MTEKAENTRSSVVSIRFKPFEAARFWEIMDAVKARNPYVDRADVVRELLGLVAPHAITAAELRYFRTGEKSSGLKKVVLRMGTARPARTKGASKGKTGSERRTTKSK